MTGQDGSDYHTDCFAGAIPIQLKDGQWVLVVPGGGEVQLVACENVAQAPSAVLPHSGSDPVVFGAVVLAFGVRLARRRRVGRPRT